MYCPLGAVNVASLLSDYHIQKTVTNQYQAAYTAKYNEPLSSFGGHAWDALHLVALALKAVGCDRAAIRNYLENHTSGFVGQHGVFKYSERDHIGLDKESFQMVIVRGGDWALAD